MDGRRAALALLLLQHLAAAVAQVIFDPASVFTTYTDDGACGARGDDAVFDISECSSGTAHLVGRDDGWPGDCAAWINDCCYRRYEVYACGEATAPTYGSTLFIYWNSGIENMPAFHQHCLDNFRRFNPTWTVWPLTLESAPQILGRHMLPYSFYDMGPALQSDAVRLAALTVFGGAWLDITSLFFRMNSLRDMYAEMIVAGKEMRLYSILQPNIMDSWFIMARPNALLMSQWHAIFMAYYGPRGAAHQIEQHDLMAALNQDDVGRLMNWWEGGADYLSIHVCFLRVETLAEWADGDWRDRVLIQTVEEGGYYIQGTMCGRGNRFDDLELERNSRPCIYDVLTGPGHSVADIHAPFNKFNGDDTISLGLDSDWDIERILNERPGCVLSQVFRILSPPPPPMLLPASPPPPPPPFRSQTSPPPPLPRSPPPLAPPPLRPPSARPSSVSPPLSGTLPPPASPLVPPSPPAPSPLLTPTASMSLEQSQGRLNGLGLGLVGGLVLGVLLAALSSWLLSRRTRHQNEAAMARAVADDNAIEDCVSKDIKMKKEAAPKVKRQRGQIAAVELVDERETGGDLD